MNKVNIILEKVGAHNTLKQEQVLAAVFENTATAILIFDSEARLSLANPAGRGLFDDYESNIGQRLSSDYEALQQFLDKARNSQASITGDIVWFDKRIFSAEIIPVQANSYMVTLNDVSRFKELEKLKNEFFATAVHDLRSPITSIIGFSHLMKVTGSLNASQSDFVQRIQQAAINMSELLENILFLAKFDFDPAFENDKVDLSHLLFEIVDKFQPQAVLKGQLLAFEKTDTQTIVPGNKSQLHQALRTLIGNAVKNTPEGGAITLSLEREANTTKIRIKDTGYGISSSDLPHIFDRFYRVRRNGHDEIEGNGLGLAIVKSIIEAHQGTIAMQSELGKGSCFIVNLPCSYTEEFPTALLKQEQETA